MFGRFFDYNEQLCSSVDCIFTKNRENAYLEAFLSKMEGHHIVADVGGGKQPARLTHAAYARDVSKYEGLDIDEAELRLAPEGAYTQTHCVDLTQVPASLFGRYDRVVCRSTLEHVKDLDGAMRGLSAMLKPNGQLFIKTTCRYAMYAIVNRILPEDLKRKMLFSIFPRKKTDGFPAYYESCSVGEILDLARRYGLEPTMPPNKMYYSSYFSFFVPLYAAWRVVSAFQLLTNKEYCERFELVLEKAPRPSWVDQCESSAAAARNGPAREEAASVDSEMPRRRLGAAGRLSRW